MSRHNGRGGHRGLSGGGGHHHHHHRGGYPGFLYPGYAYPTTTEVFTVADPCVGFDPVLATDGRTYDNPCLARRAGASVVRRVVRPATGSADGLGSIMPETLFGKAALVVGAVLAYRALTKKHYR